MFPKEYLGESGPLWGLDHSPYATLEGEREQGRSTFLGVGDLTRVLRKWASFVSLMCLFLSSIICVWRCRVWRILL